MKIFCAGSRFWGSQIERIEQGFQEVGHEITPHPHEANLLYSNDPGGYTQIIEDKKHGRLFGKVIFNVQDIPTFLPDYDVNKLKSSLEYADAVTSISQFTRNEVRKFCAVESFVVYQPIKPVFAPKCYIGEEGKYRIRFLSVGRRFDKNKRTAVWVAALAGLGIDELEVGLVGNEMGWGNYIGVQTDENLAKFYNAVDFVMALGKAEGLNLPMVEAMAVGAIPVIANDLTTREEFLPPFIFPEYLDVDPNPVSVARFVARYLNNDTAMAEMKKRLKNHYDTYWAHKLSPKGVASAILEAYNSTL